MNATILFVDDEKAVLDGIKRRLSGTPYSLLFANSGKEALGILETVKVDVIVADLVMPGISGLQLLEEVAASYPLTVRIILSGFTEVPSILNALNSNLIFRFLTKPWRIDDDGLNVLKEAVKQAEMNRSAENKAFQVPLEILLKLFDQHNVQYVVGNQAGVVEFSSIENMMGKTVIYSDSSHKLTVSGADGLSQGSEVTEIFSSLTGQTAYVTY